MTIRSLAETFDSGDLHWLKKETDEFIRLHFEELRALDPGMKTMKYSNHRCIILVIFREMFQNLHSISSWIYKLKCYFLHVHQIVNKTGIKYLSECNKVRIVWTRACLNCTCLEFTKFILDQFFNKLYFKENATFFAFSNTTKVNIFCSKTSI